MKEFGWSNLLPDFDGFPSVFNPGAKLSTGQAEELGTINRCADGQSKIICYGIQAIGELLASTAHAGELGMKTATDIGWLLSSLGELAANLADVTAHSGNRLTSIPKE